MEVFDSSCAVITGEIKSSTTCERLQEDDSRGLKFLMSLDVSVSKEIISFFDEMPPSVCERERERERERECV